MRGIAALRAPTHHVLRARTTRGELRIERGLLPITPTPPTHPHSGTHTQHQLAIQLTRTRFPGGTALIKDRRLASSAAEPIWNTPRLVNCVALLVIHMAIMDRIH